MTEPSDMDERVTALENSISDLAARVSRAEDDARAARTLAGGADRDVGELGVSSARSVTRTIAS